MNMVKDGIQTRRRRQKNSAVTSTGKLKSTKSTTLTTSTAISTVALPRSASTMMKDIKMPLINTREGPYPYGEIFPGNYSRLLTNARVSMNNNNTSFDAELLSQPLIPHVSTTTANSSSDSSTDDQQRMKTLRTTNLDQL